MQVAEDARLVTLKRQDEARIAAERQASLDRESAARAEAQAARAQADASQRLESERRARAEAEERSAKDKAEIARLEAANARSDALELKQRWLSSVLMQRLRKLVWLHSALNRRRRS